MLGKSKQQIYRCPHCQTDFKKGDAERLCSNCFACSGCEIYCCPNCSEEVVIKPKKQALGKNQKN